MQPNHFPQVIEQLKAELSHRNTAVAGLARASLEALRGEPGARFTLRRALALDDEPPTVVMLRKRLTTAVLCRDEALVADTLKIASRGDIDAHWRIGGETTEADSPDILNCHVPEPGRILYEMPRSQYVSPHLPFHVARWLGSLPCFAALGRLHRQQGPEARTGTVRLSLAVNAKTAGLAFCSRTPGAILIPDPDFSLNDGYARDVRPADWPDRRARIVWRGAEPIGEQLAALDRIHNSGRTEPWFDAQPAGAGADDDFRGARAAIEIASGRSSGPLFRKLLAGTLLLMVAPADGSCLWVHERMQPWTHYVPVAADLSDLMDRAGWVFAHDSAAQQIAANGRALALAASYEAEMATAALRIADALK